MVQPNFVKVTVQPALHIVMADSNKWDASSGMMWAARAFSGIVGVSRVHVWVDVTCAPFGRRAMRWTMAERRLVAGALVVRKWLVAPESRMAHCLIMSASLLIFFNNTEAAKALLWVGIRQ